MSEKLNRALAEVVPPKYEWQKKRPWHEESHKVELRVHPGTDLYQPYCTDCGVFDPENADFTGSIEQAFRLVEWMRREKGADFTFYCSPTRWFVEVRRALVADAEHESLPTAIALAAARALGISLETKAEAR